MLHQMDMDESTDKQHDSLYREQLEREAADLGEREKGQLSAAQVNLAMAQAKWNCMQTLREAERKRKSMEEKGREGVIQVPCRTYMYGVYVHVHV